MGAMRITDEDAGLGSKAVPAAKNMVAPLLSGKAPEVLR